MITPNHGLSGFVCAQVAMPLLRRRSPLSEGAMTLAVFLGAMLPDADIVTRWLVGRQFYFSGAWYAHRGLSHSLGGTLLVALLAAALLVRFMAPQPAAPPGAGGAAGVSAASRRWAAYGWLVACFWAGGLLHIFGDLFTPGWQMPVFWPITSLGTRVGAWRHIGWFSPYLLYLFLATALLGALLARGLARLRRDPPPLGPSAAARLSRALPVALWGLYALAAYRWVDFLVRSRYESHAQWEAFHQTLLPEVLIVPVTRGISTAWHWFTG